MALRDNLSVVILAGGEGTRFAPYSAPEKPKQFLPILSKSKTMIQQTYERIRKIVSPEQVFVSTNNRYVSLVINQLSEINHAQIIGEPIKKNTAPPIALLSWIISQKDPDAVILFLPSDHFIADTNKAVSVFKKAFDFASKEESLVTFGVPPTFPSCDYGYIRRDVTKSYHDAEKVHSFVEKPDVQTAKKYFESGKYYWNSGLFIWKASAFLKALDLHMPDLFSLLKSISFLDDGSIEKKSLFNYFDQAKSISVDYGIMEKAKNVVVFPFDVSWSDIGTWKGLADLACRLHLNLPILVKEHLNKLGFL